MNIPANNYLALFAFSLAISKLDINKQMHLLTQFTIYGEKTEISSINSKVVIAKDLDGVIGVDQKLYWKAPNDLKKFFQHTVRTITLSGNNTFLSLPKKEGKILPLKKRFNLVLSSKALAYYQDPQVISSEITNYDNVFYVQSLEQASVLLTLINIVATNKLSHFKLEQAIRDILSPTKSRREDFYTVTIAEDYNYQPELNKLIAELNAQLENSNLYSFSSSLERNFRQIVNLLEEEQINYQQVSVIGGQSLLKLFNLRNPNPIALKINQLVLTTLGIRLSPVQRQESNNIIYFDFDLSNFRVEKEESFFADNQEQIPAKIEYYVLTPHRCKSQKNIS